MNSKICKKFNYFNEPLFLDFLERCTILLITPLIHEILNVIQKIKYLQNKSARFESNNVGQF